MRKLAWFAGGFAGACLLCAYLFPAQNVRLPGALLAAGGLLCALTRRKALRRAAALCLGLGIGLLWCFGYQTVYLGPADALDGTERTLVLEAADYPKATRYGGSVETLLRERGRTYRMLLYLDDADEDLLPGDRVAVRARLARTGDAERGDEEIYDAANGVIFRASPRGPLSAERPEKMPLRWRPVWFSHELRLAIGRSFGGEAPFLAALLTGDRSGLGYAALNDMAIVGIRHCVAVSGMHLAILLGTILLLLRSNRTLGALIGLPLSWLFALMVGMTPSVVRAAVMQSLLLLAPLLGRENDPPTSILTALLLLLLPNPRVAANVGLQLSFLAVAGIFLFSGRVYRFLWEREKRKAFYRRHPAAGWAFRLVAAPFCASLAVTPMTLPLSAYYFGLVSVISPVSCALLLPAVTGAFALGLPAALLAAVWPAAGAAAAWPARLLARYVLWGAGLLSRVPYAAVYPAGPYMKIFLVFLFAAVWLAAAGRGARPARAALACVPAVFAVCLFLGAREYSRAALSVTALDVGQGQSVYLESGGANALSDCGGNAGSDGSAGETAARFLQSIGRRGLDFLLVSHYDGDHTNGIVQLLRRVPVGTMYLPDTPDDSGVRASLEAAAAAAGTRVAYVSADRALPFGFGRLELFAPAAGETGNDASVAVRCSAGDFSALVTGDLGEDGETALLSSHDLSGTDVLVAGHHGARTSTGAALLAEAGPETVLVSVGENGYGHPNPGTIARIQAAGAAVRRTDRCGNITVRREKSGETNENGR